MTMFEVFIAIALMALFMWNIVQEFLIDDLSRDREHQIKQINHLTERLEWVEQRVNTYPQFSYTNSPEPTATSNNSTPWGTST